MTLRFDINWLDAPGVQGPDAHAWADLGVSLGGASLDAVDVRARLVRPRFATSLLPLTEWIISSWPRLTEERAGPGADRIAAHAWASQHDLRFGRGGGPMPSVVIRRVSHDVVRLSAHEDLERPPGISLSFYRTVDVEVASSSVTRELARVVDVVVERLRTGDPWLCEHFTQAWTAAREPRSLAAGRLGLSMFRQEALGEGDLRALDVIAMDPGLAALCEALAEPSVEARLALARQVASALPSVDLLARESEEWRRVRIAAHAAAPWSTGWKAAGQFRDQTRRSSLSPPGASLPELLASSFGWPIDRQLLSMSTRTRGLDMITLTAPDRLPLSVTAVTAPEARRFGLAKSIYLALCGDEPSGVTVDSVRMPRHSEANAFAAELLAPAAFLSQCAPDDGTWESDDIERVAAKCAVDPRVVTHQIKNRSLGLLAG